jgi:hypothetical protein
MTHALIRVRISAVSLRSARSSKSNLLKQLVRIPTKSAVDSERRRPPIPIEAGQGFR